MTVVLDTSAFLNHRLARSIQRQPERAEIEYDMNKLTITVFAVLRGMLGPKESGGKGVVENHCVQAHALRNAS